MTSQEAPTDEKPKANPILGCGCLLVIILIIGSLAVSCLGGSDRPAAQPLPAAAPITTRAAPPTTTSSAPTSSTEPILAQPVPDRDCKDFSSQAEAQAAFLPGDPERLDPDGDGLACENYFANQNLPDTSVPDPPASSNDDDSSSGGGTRPRSGDSGHPCLPGERDGDNDGYCGEG